jgi:hypothetical protein
MNLWERDMAPYEHALDQLAPPARLALAVQALDWSYTTMRAPIEDSEALAWLAGARTAAQAAVERGDSQITLTPQAREEFGELDETVEEYGVAQYMTGYMACADFETLSAETVANVLYICYEFAAQREEPEPETIEAQQGNARCREVIAYHQDLIDRATH